MQKAACVAAEAKTTKSGGRAPKAEETTVQRERVVFLRLAQRHSALQKRASGIAKTPSSH